MMRDKLALGVALSGGILAAVCGMYYLKEQGQPPPPRQVLFANVDLPAGHQVAAGDLIGGNIPGSPEYDAEFKCTAKPEDISFLTKNRIGTPVRKGLPIYYNNLLPILEFQLAPNKCALAVPASGAATLSSVLVPGDIVSVLVTQPLQDEKPASAAQGPAAHDHPGQALLAGLRFGAGKYSSAVVATDIRVLAVGKLLHKSRFQVPGMPSEESTEVGNDVTLEVTLEQAVKILAESGAFTHVVTLVVTGKTPEGGTAAWHNR